MATISPDKNQVSDPPSNASSHESASLCWTVHLLRREPKRLPTIVIVLGIGALSVWTIFHTLLPVLIAILLLTSSISDYLFPITYFLSDTGVGQKSITSHIYLPWSEIRRCVPGTHRILLTTLSTPSRLDAFRGVLLRFAPEGQPGDRQSVLTYLSTISTLSALDPDRTQTE